VSDKKYIPIDQCVDRGVYRIKSRNLSMGVYRAEVQGFIGIRLKFDDRYLFTEYHYDTGAPFGTVKPKEQIGMLPDNIDCRELAKHEFGDSFGLDPETKKERAIVRRDLAENEKPHGGRKGFVDEWADTHERTSDNLFPYVKENKELFAFLESLEKTLCQ